MRDPRWKLAEVIARARRSHAALGRLGAVRGGSLVCRVRGREDFRWWLRGRGGLGILGVEEEAKGVATLLFEGTPANGGCLLLLSLKLLAEGPRGKHAGRESTLCVVPGKGDRQSPHLGHATTLALIGFLQRLGTVGGLQAKGLEITQILLKGQPVSAAR